MDHVTAEPVALTAAYHTGYLIVTEGGVVDYATTDSEASMFIHAKDTFTIDHPLHRKCAQAVGDYPVPTFWCRRHAPPDRRKHWQAKHTKSNRGADTESHTAAQLSAQGCAPVLPTNLGNIWPLYDTGYVYRDIQGGVVGPRT